MNILIMDESLTVIKSMEQARKVLERVRKQSVPLMFDTGTFTKARFTPQKDGEWTVWEFDTKSTIPVEFQPSLRVTEDEAIKRLYQLRKHYNQKWRD